MPKAYWIAHVDVRNDEGYKPYAAANPAIFASTAAVLSHAAANPNASRAGAARAMS